MATPEVGGVQVARHVLDVETERLLHLARRVGLRLRTWARQMPTERAAVLNIDGEWIPVLDDEGKPVMMPLIPDKEFRENAEWYSKSILGLLKEQRERAKLTPNNGGAPIDDETFELELADLARQTIREMPEAELAKLLAERVPDAD